MTEPELMLWVCFYLLKSNLRQLKDAPIDELRTPSLRTLKTAARFGFPLAVNSSLQVQTSSHAYFVDVLLIVTTRRITTSKAITVQSHIPPPIHPPPIHPFTWFIMIVPFRFAVPCRPPSLNCLCQIFISEPRPL
jgi:hypothetical protein